MKRTFWSAFAGIGVAVALAAGYAYLKSAPRTAQRSSEPQPIPVIAATVQRKDVPIALGGVGTVVALNKATIRSQLLGQLVSVNFQEGQLVKKGDLLGQIDQRTYQAQLAQAEATLAHDQAHLANAQHNLERYVGLARQDSIAAQQVDDQRATVDELGAQIKIDQALIDSDKTQLSYTSLVAPFDGLTGMRLLDVGNLMYPPRSTAAVGEENANALVVVTQVQPIAVVFTLPTTDLPAIQSAMATATLPTIAFSQDGKTELDAGKLVLVNNQADPGSGTVQLKAEFPNALRRLWPGSFVNVRLILSSERDGLTIPLDAVQQGPQGPIVPSLSADLAEVSHAC